MRVVLFFIIFIFVGCSHNVQRVDSKALQLTTIHWGSEDLNEMAEAMVTSVLKDDYLTTPSKKVLAFLKIKNSTYDHIDTKSITDSIKTGLIKSARANIIDIKQRDTLNTELEYQKEKQKYYKKIKKIGRQLGVDAFFFGEISAIYQKNSTIKNMGFTFVLNLVDVQSAQLVWSETMNIQKLYKKSFIGW